MGARYVNVDRQTPLLLPTDLREWVAADDPVHLVIEAVEQMELSSYGSQRGTGSEQYPPAMMLALLIHCYGLGIYSSRRIELATYRDVSVRYLTADTHPDHDTIAAFRRQHGELLRRAFVEVLQVAHAMGVPQLGTIVLDGTKLRANASARHNRKESQLRAELQQLEHEVNARLQRADEADAQSTNESLPQELANAAERRAKVQAAREAVKRRAQAQKRPPNDDDVGNTTDPDSRVQRTSEGFIQGYNAQMAVSADSGLIVGAHVCDNSHDRHQLARTVAAIPEVAGVIKTVVADTGYDNHEQVKAVESRGAAVFVPPQPPYKCHARQSHSRSAITMERTERLQRVRSPEGQALMRLRRCVIEPIFGTLKASWRFTRFNLRGLAGVNAEWTLLCVAYNLRKLHRWRLANA